jgi:O-antigen/teichoic acid export membrane protein
VREVADGDRGTRATSSASSRAFRGSSTYVALSLLQRVVPFLLLPAFTSVLSPSEFGRIASVTAVVAAIGAVLGLGIESWVVRQVVQLQGNDERADEFLNTIGLFSFAAPILGALVTWLAFGVVPALQAVEPDSMLMAMALLAMAMQTTTTVFLGAVLRARERLRAYAVLSIIQGIGGPLAGVLLVITLSFGVGGWFGAALLASIASAVTGLLLVRPRWSGRFTPSLVGSALAFGLPLLPHAVSHWALNLSDRILLTASVGASEAGIYNIAYQLAAPIGLILIALRQGLMPMYASAAHDEGARGEIARLAVVQVHVTGFLGLAVALIGPIVIWLFFPDSYLGGAALIPWVAFGFVFFGLYLIPVDSLSLMLGRTRWISIPTLVAAATNVILNLLFIPELGAKAAAINTAVAYAVLFGGVAVLRRFEGGPRVSYPLGPMAMGLAPMAIAWVVATIVEPSFESALGIAARAALVLTAGILVLVGDIAWWRSKRHHVLIVAGIAGFEDPEGGALAEATRA